MNSVEKGRIFEKEAEVILKRRFEKVEYLGNKRRTFDFRCYSDGKWYNVETKFSNGIGVTFYPKERDADIILIKLGEHLFWFNKLIEEFNFEKHTGFSLPIWNIQSKKKEVKENEHKIRKI